LSEFCYKFEHEKTQQAVIVGRRFFHPWSHCNSAKKPVIMPFTETVRRKSVKSQMHMVLSHDVKLVFFPNSNFVSKIGI